MALILIVVAMVIIVMQDARLQTKIVVMEQRIKELEKRVL
jgi:hypothetical protein